MDGQEQPPRWHYRFNNFARAFFLLREGVEMMHARSLSQLEKEGLIQRFEYCWELAWKTQADYLAAQGVTLATVTPRSVVRAAFAAGLIDDGDGWMAALDVRNRMSHTYDFALFEQAIAAIDARFLALFDALHQRLLREIVEDGGSGVG